HPPGALGHPRVDEVADARAGLLPEGPRADVALDERRVPAEFLLAHRLDLDRLQLALETLLVDLAVARQADGEGLAGAVRVLEHHEDVLDGVPRPPRAVLAGEPRVVVVHEGLD